MMKRERDAAIQRAEAAERNLEAATRVIATAQARKAVKRKYNAPLDRAYRDSEYVIPCVRAGCGAGVGGLMATDNHGDINWYTREGRREFERLQRQALQDLGLTSEEVERGMQPLRSFHAGIDEEEEREGS